MLRPSLVVSFGVYLLASTGSTPIKVSTTDYIQCEQVSGTDGTVVTNLYYNIVEKVSGRALYGNYYKNHETNHYKVEKWPLSEDRGKYSKWTLQKADGEYYNIIEKVSGRALYGNYYKNHETNHYKVEKWPLSVDGGKYSKWTLQKADGKYYNIVEKVSGRALYGNYYKNHKTNHYKVEKWPLSEVGGKYSKWSFIPVDYSLSAEINSFEFIGDIAQIINKHKKVDFIDEHVLLVDDYTTGSSISRTFSKERTDTFSWGMDQRLGINVSVETQVKLPLVGGASTTVEASFDYGFNQQWTKSESYIVSATATLVPQKAGRYKMTGWGDIAENVKMPYKAKALLKAKHGDDYVSGYGVKALFLHEGLDAEIIKINADSILVEVSGTIEGSYWLQTCTSIQKMD